MKYFLLLLLALPGISPMQSRAQVLADSTRKQLTEGIRGFMERYHSPSIVVAIVHDQEMIFSEALGYSDLQNKIPATVHSRYPVQSVTKSFTATMFMQLLERQKVRIDDAAKKYVPEFRDSPAFPDENNITLLQLATHTAGLPRNSPAHINFTKQVDRWLLGGESIVATTPATKKEFFRSLSVIKKAHPAYQLLSCGDRHYSNLGYSLLGIALERAAKTDYAAYVTNTICRPLGMSSSGFDTEPSSVGSVTKGYLYNDSTGEFRPTPVFKANAAIYAGGLYSTATDLAKFISFQFDHSAKAARLLSFGNRAMMYHFRIGWKHAFPYVLHEGANLGFRSEVVINPGAKIGWVILTNTTDFDFNRINEYISRLVLPVFAEKERSGLDKFTGTYQLEGGYDSLSIYLKEGKLYSTYLEAVLPETPLEPSGINKFKAQKKGNYTIGYDFVSDDKGQIRFLTMGQLMWNKQ